MHLVPGSTAAEEVLRVVAVLFVILGVVAVRSGLGVLKGRRGSTPAKVSPLHLALGIAMLVGGVVVLAFRGGLAPEPEVISAERFSSGRAPAISVTAPSLWQFEHDEQAGRLDGVRPGVRLMIETTFVTDSNDKLTTLNAVTAPLRRTGLGPMGEPFSASFDGLQAVGSVGTTAAASMAIWVVERPGKLFTIITCTADTGPDALTACDPVLSTLKWRRPGTK